MISLDALRVRPDPAAVTAAVTAARERGPDVALDPAAVRSARAARPASADPRHGVRAFEVAGPAGPVPIRVVGPERPSAVQVTAHSSGWCVGGADQDDAFADALADARGIATVEVEYRLAPEHPFPAGADDVHAVAVWALGGGACEPGTPVFLTGASAGAHLTLLTALRLRAERPGPYRRIAGLGLRYGCYDIGGSPSLRAAGPDSLVVTPRRHASMLAHAFPGLREADSRTAVVSPLYDDLSGLPPVRIDVGDRDPLLDDSLFLAARLAAAGVPTDAAVWPGCPHSFDALDPRLCADYAARLGTWMAAVAFPAGPPPSPAAGALPTGPPSAHAGANGPCAAGSATA